MKENEKIATETVTGITDVFLGNLVSFIIGVIGSVLVARLLGPNGLGMVTIALILPYILVILGDLGVSQAAAKYTAEIKDQDERSSIVSSGIAFSALYGVMLTIVGYFIANIFATTVLNKPEVAFISSITIFLVFPNLINSFILQSFLGLDYTKPITILWSVSYGMNFLSAIILIYSGYGILGPILGHVIGPFASLIVSLPFLYKRIKFKKPEIRIIKNMLTYGLPLQGGNFTIVFLRRVYDLLLARSASSTSIGNYAAAQKFESVYNALLIPITLALLPAFSKLDSKKSKNDISIAFEYTIRYAAMLIVPLSLFTFIFAESIINLILLDNFTEAPTYLRLIAISWCYIGSGQTILQTMLSGQGYTKTLMKTYVTVSPIGLILALILIPKYGPVGLIITILITHWPQAILIYRAAKLKNEIEYPFSRMARVYLSAILAMIPIIIIANTVNNEIIKIGISAIIFLPTYTITSIVTKSINEADIRIVDITIGNYAYIGGIVKKILNIISITMMRIK